MSSASYSLTSNNIGHLFHWVGEHNMTPRMDYLQRYAVARKTALHVTIMQSGDRLGRQVGEQRDFCLLPTFWELHRLTVD